MTNKKKVTKMAKDIRKATGLKFVAALKAAKAVNKPDAMDRLNAAGIAWRWDHTPISDDPNFHTITVVGPDGDWNTW